MFPASAQGTFIQIMNEPTMHIKTVISVSSLKVKAFWQLTLAQTQMRIGLGRKVCDTNLRIKNGALGFG